MREEYSFNDFTTGKHSFNNFNTEKYPFDLENCFCMILLQKIYFQLYFKTLFDSTSENHFLNFYY